MKIINKFLNHETLSYLIFGVLTTLVNLATYKLCTSLMLQYTTATVIAWIVSVLFAYITNKLFVFRSKSFHKELLFKEITTFVTSRVFSGICDLAFMIFAVEWLYMDDFYAKIFTNVFVVVINYISSKLFVFKER